MKKNKPLAFILIAFIGLAPLSEAKAQYVDVNISLFRNELGNHGRWIHNPRFGEVWLYNDAGFRPYYSNGHWEYTNYGWAWVSDFDWGWAPFHYGRWEYDPYYGWMWIPGYEWAPAWVSWSSYDGYYGWAPLGYGININFSFGSIPYDRWTFIPRQHMCERDINRYYMAPERNHFFRNAVVINNIYEGHDREGRFMKGPDRDEVQRFTNNRIEERKVDYRDRQGNHEVFNDRRKNGDQNINNNDNTRPGRKNIDDPANNDNKWGNDRIQRKKEMTDDNNNTTRPRNDNQWPNRNNNDNPPLKPRNDDQQWPRNNNNDNPPVKPRNENQQWPNRNNNDNTLPARPRFDNQQNNTNDRPQYDLNKRQQPIERPVREQRNEPVTQSQRIERRQENNGQGNQRSNDNPNRGGGRKWN